MFHPVFFIRHVSMVEIIVSHILNCRNYCHSVLEYIVHKNFPPPPCNKHMYGRLIGSDPDKQTDTHFVIYMYVEFLECNKCKKQKSTYTLVQHLCSILHWYISKTLGIYYYHQ